MWNNEKGQFNESEIGQEIEYIIQYQLKEGYVSK